jgi:predicted  nucleic acid-binding Zn-ribbon protein
LGALEANEEFTCSLVNVGVIASESRGCKIHEESSAESQSKFVHYWENPSEWLDKASTEVADMEMQIKLLQQDVSEFKAERDKFESNLIEGFHLENQAKLHHNIVDLGARVQMKGVQFAEMLGSPKSKLHEKVETVDLAELRRELQSKESKIAELTCILQAKDNLIVEIEVMIGVYSLCTVSEEPSAQTAQSFVLELICGVDCNLETIPQSQFVLTSRLAH